MREWKIARWGWIVSSRARIADAVQPHFAEPVPAERLEEYFLVCENSDNWRCMIDLARDENGSRAADLGYLSQPVLLLWGARDIAYRPERFAAEFARLLPRARLVLVSDAGHYPHEERPADVAREIRAFVAPHTGRMTCTPCSSFSSPHRLRGRPTRSTRSPAAARLRRAARSDVERARARRVRPGLDPPCRLARGAHAPRRNEHEPRAARARALGDRSGPLVARLRRRRARSAARGRRRSGDRARRDGPPAVWASIGARARPRAARALLRGSVARVRLEPRSRRSVRRHLVREPAHAGAGAARPVVEIDGSKLVHQACVLVFADVETIKRAENDYRSYPRRAGSTYESIYPRRDAHLRGLDERGNPFAGAAHPLPLRPPLPVLGLPLRPRDPEPHGGGRAHSRAISTRRAPTSCG